jgi:hypothetical protein
MSEAEGEVCVLGTFIVAVDDNGREVIGGSVGYNSIELPNVKDEPRRYLARGVRKHDS